MGGDSAAQGCMQGAGGIPPPDLPPTGQWLMANGTGAGPSNIPTEQPTSSSLAHTVHMDTKTQGRKHTTNVQCHVCGMYHICALWNRLATSVCQVTRDEMELGPTGSHTGHSRFLLSSGATGADVSV